MIVETLAIGTELLLGQIVNTNASEIGERLALAGLDHFHQTVIGDNLERIVDAVRLASERADALIITGGIGPTQDDLTREALCAAAGVEMAFSDDYAKKLRAYWESRGREMPESNLRQAAYPSGAEMIANPKGTAPGIKMKIDAMWVFAVPGVPQEMLPMIEREVIPFLQSQSGDDETVITSRVVRTWGESESKVADLLGDLYESSRNPTLAFLASSGEIKVRVTAKAATLADAEALIEPVAAEVMDRLGSRVFGVDDQTIEHVLYRLLGDRQWTIGTAESATGGLIASRLTSVPGASEHYRGSVVAYATGVKQRVLGVPQEVLADGVVSETTAIAMADGARNALGVDVAVAVTGSAGPDPQERAVGTMIIGVVTPEFSGARTLKLPGDRERVRVYTTTAALHHVRLALTGSWPTG